MTENFRESALVVVEALLGFIVDSTNVNDDVTSIEDGRVARALEVWVARVSIESRGRERNTNPRWNRLKSGEGEKQRELHHNEKFHCEFQ